MDVICDDFASESYLNESWTAYATNLSTIPSSLLRWSNGYQKVNNAWVDTLSQSTAYTVAAYLATEILNLNSTPHETQAQLLQQEQLSYAMWGLFDGGSSTGPFVGGFLNSTDLQAAEGDLTDAETQVAALGLTTANYANVTIFTYDSSAGLPTGCGSTCPPPPQEFITVNAPPFQTTGATVDEPSSPAVLALDLLAVVGLMVGFRRRITSVWS